MVPSHSLHSPGLRPCSAFRHDASQPGPLPPACPSPPGRDLPGSSRRHGLGSCACISTQATLAWQPALSFCFPCSLLGCFHDHLPAQHSHLSSLVTVLPISILGGHGYFGSATRSISSGSRPAATFFSRQPRESGGQVGGTKRGAPTRELEEQLASAVKPAPGRNACIFRISGPREKGCLPRS